MPRKTTITGNVTDCREPNWAPLFFLVGPLGDWFMWMFEVELKDGRRVQAYKHRCTRRYLHLDDDYGAYAYLGTDRQKPGPDEDKPDRYERVDLAGSLIAVFRGWEDSYASPTATERRFLHALVDYVIAAPWDRDEAGDDTLAEDSQVELEG
jgi:hypothetical protein